MTKPILADHNELSLLDSGIWVKADAAERSFIDYTDGDSSENTVYAHVSSAADRSVYSPELDIPWEDWALEYHLGSKRSNIYRGLNLDGVKTVLEVGCGCGAITRFLGEQGYRVDAIEGTLRRAQIARMRTEELDNVQIISSNYHELRLPEHTYDLVVFTGVLEYSGAYAPDGVSPEAQLELTLRLAKAALSSDGIILVAIENRTGFKYLAGASEDHLNVQNIGLLGYTEPASGAITRDIRTWSKAEWQSMLADFGFAAFDFCYPFPDYKVPDAILSDSFLGSARYPEQVLGGVSSRDYSRIWWPAVSEPLFWRTAVQTGSLDQYANSFLIVISDSSEPIRRCIDFDFVRFASVRRKLSYRNQVVKTQGEEVVKRIALVAADEPEDRLVTQHHIVDEKFIDGQVLDQLWSQALMVLPSYQELSRHLQIYGDWLKTLIAEGGREYVDALPQNIIVDQEGEWHLIDQEWHAVEEISLEVIVFRTLLNYVLNARVTLADMELHAARQAMGVDAQGLEIPLIQTLEDFVQWGFEQLDLDYARHRDSCIKFENRLHKQVSVTRFVADLESFLSAPIYQWHSGQSFESPSPLEVRAFWTQLDGVWHLDHSAAVKTSLEHGMNICLELPPALITHRYLRIDPAADVLLVFRGWLEFGALSIKVTRSSGDEQNVYHIDSTEQLYHLARINGMRLVMGDKIMLTSSDASMVLDLKGVDWGEDVQSIHLGLIMDVSSDRDMVAVRQLLREESIRSAYRVRLRQHMLDQLQERLDNGEQRLEMLNEKIAQSSTTPLGRLLGRFGLMRKHKV